MTGEHPFSNIKRTPEVLIRMQSGDRPPRPTDPAVVERGLNDAMWNLLTRCWSSIPQMRPSVQQVLAELP